MTAHTHAILCFLFGAFWMFMAVAFEAQHSYWKGRSEERAKIVKGAK